MFCANNVMCMKNPESVLAGVTRSSVNRINNTCDSRSNKVLYMQENQGPVLVAVTSSSIIRSKKVLCLYELLGPV